MDRQWHHKECQEFHSRSAIDICHSLPSCVLFGPGCWIIPRWMPVAKKPWSLIWVSLYTDKKTLLFSEWCLVQKCFLQPSPWLHMSYYLFTKNGRHNPNWNNEKVAATQAKSCLSNKHALLKLRFKSKRKKNFKSLKLKNWRQMQRASLREASSEQIDNSQNHVCVSALSNNIKLLSPPKNKCFWKTNSNSNFYDK